MPRPPLDTPAKLVVKVTGHGKKDVHAKDYVPIVKLHRAIHPDRLQELMTDNNLKREVFERLKERYSHRKYRERKGYSALHGEEG